MDRQKDATFFDTPFVTLRFKLWYTHTNQCANDPTDDATRAEPCERRHDRACGYKWSESRNSQSADACEQAESPSNRTACDDAGGSAFRRFGVFLVGETFVPTLS